MTATTDPPCGCDAQVLELKDGRVYLRHDSPKALTPHYPLPPLGSEAIPLYRGPFTRDGKTYRGLVKLGLRPIPRLWVRGKSLETVSVADLHAWLSAEEFIGWTERSEVHIPKTSAAPRPPSTARFPTQRQVPGVMDTGHFMPRPITINAGVHVDEVTFFLLNGWQADD